MKESLLTLLSLVRNIRQGISEFNTRIGQVLHGCFSALAQQNGNPFSRTYLTRCALVVALLMGSVNVWGATITIDETASGINDTDDEQIITVDGHVFKGKFKQYATTALWFTSGSGYIYNTESLGTINSITINYKSGGSGSAKQYFSSGSSAISSYQSGTPQLTTSTGGSNGSYSTFSGGFFNISISNKNLQAVSIVIDYTASGGGGDTGGDDCTEPTDISSWNVTENYGWVTNTTYDFINDGGGYWPGEQNLSAPTFECTSTNSSSCTINGSSFSASAAGTYEIKATQAAYNDYCAVEKTFTVVVAAAATTTPHDVMWIIGGDIDNAIIHSGVAHGSKPTLPATPTCEGKTFAGWTETETYEDTTAPTDLFTDAAGAPDINADKFFYAVFSSTNTGGGGTVTSQYEKVTTAPADWSGEYLIVYETGNLIFDGSLTTFDAVGNTQSVTITNNTIDNEAASYQFTIAAMTGGYSICGTSGRYIAQATNANGLTNSDTASANTLSINDDGSVNIVSSGGAYLRYNSASNQTRFRYYKSSSYSSQNAIHLYKKTTTSGGSTTTYTTSCSGGGSTCTTLATPTIIGASEITSSSVKLSWNGVANASSYQLRYTKVEAGAPTVELNVGNVTSYNLSGLEAETAYRWTIQTIGDSTNYCSSEKSLVGDFTTIAAAVGETTEWVLVTDASTLAAGDEVVIASNTKGMTATDITSSVMGNIASTFYDDLSTITTLGEGTVIFTLGGSAGAWTLANSNGQLLGATAEKKLAWDSGTQTWTIDIDASGTEIGNTNTECGTLQYNASSPRFTTYTSSQTAVQLYRKEVAGPEHTITTAVPGGNGTITAPATAKETRTVSITANPAAGYTFAGWTIENTDGTTEGVPTLSSAITPTATFTMGSKDVTVTAAFVEGEWTLLEDINYLQAGDKVLIADNNDETLAVAGTQTTNKNAFLAETITYSSDKTKVTGLSPTAFIFTMDGEYNTWQFLNSENQALGADLDNNGYINFTTDGRLTNWAIEVLGKNSTQISVTNNSQVRTIYHNTATPNYFGAFTNKESRPYPSIYYKDNTNPRLIVNKYTIYKDGDVVLMTHPEFKSDAEKTEYKNGNYTSFNVKGQNLTDDGPGKVEVIEGEFELALVGTRQDALSSLDLTKDNVSDKTEVIYVRLKADLAQGTYTGKIRVSYPGAQDRIVTVKGEVTAPRVLDKIEVTPTILEYPEGSTLTKEIVTATFTDGTTAIVTESAVFNADLTGLTTDKETRTVTVTYTHSVDNEKSVTYDITVYNSNWHYAVVFYDSGKEYASRSIVYNGTITDLPTTPAGCEGYTFTGWTDASSIDANVEPTYFDFTTAIKKTYNLYAVYAIQPVDNGDENVFKLVTSADELSAGDRIIITNGKVGDDSGKVFTMEADGTGNNRKTKDVEIVAESITVNSSDIQVITLEQKNSETEKKFYFNVGENAYLYAASSSSNHLKTASQATAGDNGYWTISVSSDGVASIQANGTNTHNKIRYNSGSTLFSCYTSGQNDVYIFRSGAVGVVTYTLTPACGPGLSANPLNITSAKDIEVQSKAGVITAVRVDDTPTNLTATIEGTDASFFSVTVGEWTTQDNIISAPYHVTYKPTVSGQATHTANIKFSAEDKDGETLTAIVPIIGYCLPDEFVIAVQNNGTWVVLPGNMDNASTYTCATITVDNTTNPTKATNVPDITIYKLLDVHTSKIATSLTQVRFQNVSSTKCLWSNNSSSSTDIKYDGANASGTTANYEWILATTNGVNYTLYNENRARYLGMNGTDWGMYVDSKKVEVRFLPYEGTCTTMPIPTNLIQTEITANSITIQFSPVATAKGYELKQDEGDWTAITPTQNGEYLQYTIEGLTEATEYTFSLRAVNDDLTICGENNGRKIVLSTETPFIDIVDWGIYEDADNDLVKSNPDNKLGVTINLSEENASATVSIGKETIITDGSENAEATDLFFSKYYEATGNLKLLGIYNGTNRDIDLSKYHIYMAKDAEEYKNQIDLGQYGSTSATIGTIKAGTEIILYNDNTDFGKSVESGNLGDCIAQTLGTTLDDDNKLQREGWYYNTKISWGGDKCIALYKDNDDNTSTEMIDIIGAWKESSGKIIRDGSGTYSSFPTSVYPDYTFIDDASKDNHDSWFKIGEDFETHEKCILSTNRCLLIRKSIVTSGDNAVNKNQGDFITLGEEWMGRNVGAGEDGSATQDNVSRQRVCETFSAVSGFDYTQYYVTYTPISSTDELDGMHNTDGTYTVPIPTLRDLACKRIKIETKVGEEVILSTQVRVPIIIDANEETNGDTFDAIGKIHKNTESAPDLTTAEIAKICTTCDVVVKGGGVTLTHNGQTDYPQINDLYVYPGAKFKIASGKYNINSVILRSEGDNVPHLILPEEEGKELESKLKTVKFTKRIPNDRYYFFSLPFNCDVRDITFSNGLGLQDVDWEILYYDGAKRVENKGLESNWLNVGKDAILEAGQGYALAIGSENSNYKKEVVFPMTITNTKLDDMDNVDKTIAITPHGIVNGVPREDRTPNHLGWNFVGNPYLTTYGQGDLMDEDTKVGKLVEVDNVWEWQDKDNIYITLPIGDQHYTQDLSSNQALPPFFGFFVQATGTALEYLTENVENKALIAPRYTPAQDDSKPVFAGVTLSNGAYTDKTSLVVNDQYTQAYEIGADLEKMIGFGDKPQVYVIDDAYRYAFKALNETDAAKANKLGVYLPARTATTYTFDLIRNYDLSRVQGVYLTDHVAGTTINLLQSEYTFTSGYAYTNDRFSLSVVLAPKIATQLTQTAIGWSVWQDAPLHISLQGLTVGDNVSVIDATGKLVHQTTVTDSSTAFDLPSIGAYCVQAIGTNGLQVKKVVVK